MAGLDEAVLVSEASGVDPPVRVVICDDHEVLRHGLRAVLRRIPGVVVVAEASCGGEVLSLAAAVHPDVVLVGLEGEGPDLRDLVRELTRTGIRVLLLGEAGDGSDLVEVLRAGASGYVHSTVSSQRLVDCVRAVARGETVLDAGVTGELLHRLEEDTGDPADDGRRGPLTARQQTVAELVAQGLTNAEIADRLQVSRATVKGHVTVALRRLGLRDRTQLAIHVHRNPHPGGTGPSRE
ncbi:response regulator transcription factor [Geodermatophilus sp. DSM 45219]|uniref:LuxR C-terminal-related transcriptional regulator n=1 Tax=Geodermatophilus sp. DSM 45219 TaxID=1881103 RepID=UPI00088F4601|nr:response regulator transcription factor [Geodermatophilus sp. DSM 45219]SDO07660.1 two-component system, NarL family, response regulator LiaR [Geodermatophilus sp. DSM 45219]